MNKFYYLFNTINIDDNIQKALNTLSKNKIKRIIVHDNKKIVGILSISDLLNNTQNDDLINCIKTIWEINPNKYHYDTDVSDFYL